ncbi:MAG TPA: hypothetical protein VJZ78_01825 [Anaerolineales bacterium]|nr:hypothetical protein [Anaerolineales bacterium]
MTIEFDDKGKFFTDVILKTAVPSIIQTTKQRIHGSVHIRRDERFKDEMDRDEKFLAVTDATVFSKDGQVLYQCEFLSIQRSHIIWAIPESDLIKPNPEPGAK